MKKLIEILENAYTQIETDRASAQTLRDYYQRLYEEEKIRSAELREERDAIAAERDALIAAAARTNASHQRRITDLEEECAALSSEVDDLRAKVYGPLPVVAPVAAVLAVDHDAVTVDPGETAYLDKVQEAVDGNQ